MREGTTTKIRDLISPVRKICALAILQYAMSIRLFYSNRQSAPPEG